MLIATPSDMSFSTHGMHEDEAYLAWREKVSRKQFGLECDLVKNTRFSGTIDSWMLGNVSVSQISAAGQKVESHPVYANVSTDDFLFLDLIISGAIHIEQSGRMVSVPAGAMVLLDPQRQFTKFVPEPTELVVLTLPRRELRSRGMVPRVIHHPLAIDQTDATGAMIWHLLNTIAYHSRASSRELGTRLGDQILDFMDLFIASAQGSIGNTTTEATLARVKNYIHRHLADSSLNADKIAREVGLSPRYINQLFAEEGTSLMRYLWHVRIERAGVILGASANIGLAIEEVGNRCGFRDLSHFSRSFKARHGMSPRQYRSTQIDAARVAVDEQVA